MEIIRVAFFIALFGALQFGAYSLQEKPSFEDPMALVKTVATRDWAFKLIKERAGGILFENLAVLGQYTTSAEEMTGLKFVDF